MLFPARTRLRADMPRKTWVEWSGRVFYAHATWRLGMMGLIVQEEACTQVGNKR